MRSESQSPLRIELPSGRLLRLYAARGSALRVLHGTVWITAEACLEDWFLGPGECHEVTCDGLVLVEVHGSPRARLEIRGARAGRAAARRPALAGWLRLV